MGRSFRRGTAFRFPEPHPKIAIQRRTYSNLRATQACENLLVGELNRLLEPSKEFIRLAIGNIETRKQTDSVVEYWKPVLANALEEWVKQRMLLMALSTPLQNDRKAGDAGSSAAKVVTTKEELDGFETIKRLLGPDRPVAYEDTASYFKLHLPERHTWAICRLYFDRKRPSVWVPLPIEESQRLAPSFNISVLQLGWSCLMIDSFADLEMLGELLRVSWDSQRSSHPVDEVKDRSENQEPEPASSTEISA